MEGTQGFRAPFTPALRVRRSGTEAAGKGRRRLRAESRESGSCALGWHAPLHRAEQPARDVTRAWPLGSPAGQGLGYKTLATKAAAELRGALGTGCPRPLLCSLGCDPAWATEQVAKSGDKAIGLLLWRWGWRPFAFSPCFLHGSSNDRRTALRRPSSWLPWQRRPFPEQEAPRRRIPHCTPGHCTPGRSRKCWVAAELREAGWGVRETVTFSLITQMLSPAPRGQELFC